MKQTNILYFLLLCLSAAFIFHGIWNIGPEGQTFWNSSQVIYPQFLRMPVGLLEIILGLSLWSTKLRSISALGIALMMIGAILNNLPQGYSYKNLGVEVPIVYLAISMQFISWDKYWAYFLKLKSKFI